MNALSDFARSDYERIISDFGWVAVDDTLMALRGADAASWLQGQVTQDLRDWAIGECRSMCLCKPTGQLLAVLHGMMTRDKIYLSTDRRCASQFAARVEAMVIMEDVELDTLDLVCVSAQGPESARAEANGIRIPHDRSGRTGYDFWMSDRSVEVVVDEVAELIRVEAGRPKFLMDWNEKTLPPELGAKFEADTISYKKGCYTGQEVLMRIFSRGHTNRCLTAITSDEALSPRMTLYQREEKVGEITSAVCSPTFGFIGLGMLKNSADMDAAVLADGGLEVRPVQIPLVSAG